MAATSAPVSTSRGVAAPSADPLVYYTDYADFIASANPNAAFKYPDGRVARKQSGDPQAGLYVTDADGAVIPAGQIQQENSDNSGFDVGIVGIPTNAAYAATGGVGLGTAIANHDIDGKKIRDTVDKAIDWSGLGGGSGGPSAPASTLGTSDFVKGLIDSANTPINRSTPTIAPATAPAPGTVVAPQVDQGAKAAALSAPGATPTVAAGQVATPGNITAGTQTITAQGATAGQAGHAAPVTAQTIGRQVLDTTNSDQSRAAFMDALAKVKIAAEGGSPSAAEWLLRKAIDENIGTSYGMAAALQGRNPGLALRTGAITAKDAIAKSAADKAALAAAEQATARGQYGEFARSLNANDIDQSKAQLGADVTVATENAGNALKAMTATAANDVTVNVANAANQTAVSIANQTAALDASKATAANQLAAAIQDSINKITVEVGNRDAALKAADANATRAANMQIAQYQAQISTYQQEQQNLYDAAKQNSINQTNTNIAFSQNQTTRDIAQVEAELKARGLDDIAINNLRQLGLDAMKAAAADARAGQEIDTKKYAADQAFKAAIVGGGAQIGTSILTKLL